MINCPHCDKVVRVGSEMDGKKARCPGCRQRFLIRFRNDDECVHDDEPIHHHDNGKHEPIHHQPAVSPTVILLAIWRWIDFVCDFRFRRYLTPWIVRVWWAMVLLLCILSFLFQSFPGSVLAALSPFQDERAATTSQFQISKVAPQAEVHKPTKAEKAMGELLDWGFTTVVRLISTLIGLTCLRVLAELMIVLFNISNSLKGARFKPQSV
jgi:hypothetical protein